MDPQLTLYEALAAIEEEDHREAAILLDSLADWIGNGGFLPKVEIQPNGYYLVDRNS